MDASKLTQMRAKASNTYRSNWQPRDASEVTQRRAQMSQKDNSSTHQGPGTECCTGGGPNLVSSARAASPSRGYSTTYSEQIVFEKKAGCAQCADPNFGAPGGVQLLTCAEVATILAEPPNPVKGSSCYCADPGIYKQPGVVSAAEMTPSYTGWRNQVPTLTPGSTVRTGTLCSLPNPMLPSA
jgi:hypothetical protein